MLCWFHPPPPPPFPIYLPSPLLPFSPVFQEAFLYKGHPPICSPHNRCCFHANTSDMSFKKSVFPGGPTAGLTTAVSGVVCRNSSFICTPHPPRRWFFSCRPKENSWRDLFDVISRFLSFMTYYGMFTITGYCEAITGQTCHYQRATNTEEMYNI